MLHSFSLTYWRDPCKTKLTLCSVSFVFGLWLCVVSIFLLFLFLLLCFASSIHQSHTQRDYLLFSWFPPGRVPMFFFPSLTLTSQPSSPYFPPSLPLSSSSLAFLFGCEGRLFIYSDKIYSPPPLTSPHPPVFLSFSFHSLITFLFPPWLCTCRVSLWGGEGGRKKGRAGEICRGGGREIFKKRIKKGRM